MAGELYETEKTWWRGRQNALERAFDFGKQQNQYDQSLYTAQREWDRSDMLHRLAQQRSQLPGSYNRRNMLNSGMWQQGLTDYARQRGDALNRFDQADNLKMYGFAMTNNQLGRTYTESTDDLNAQMEALRRTRASNYGSY